MKKPVYAVVFSPHPADTEFGVGGTVARWVREGKDIVYVIATNGDKGSSDPAISSAELAGIRENEQKAAAQVLGIQEVVFLGHPDLDLENVSGLKKEILRLFLSYKPEVVMTCDPYNPPYFSSPDHRALGRAVLDAVWPLAQAPNYYRDLIAEGLELHRAKELYIWQCEKPNCYIDISDTWELKQKAIDIHQSQIGPNGSNPDFPKMLKEGNERYGREINVAYAEGFNKLEVLQRL